MQQTHPASLSNIVQNTFIDAAYLCPLHEGKTLSLSIFLADVVALQAFLFFFGILSLLHCMGFVQSTKNSFCFHSLILCRSYLQCRHPLLLGMEDRNRLT